MADIEHQLSIGASAERIWPSLTTAEGLSGWWTLGETRLEGDPGAIGIFIFRSRAGVTHLEVLSLSQPRQITWRPIESNAPGSWRGTAITFDLFIVHGKTRLEFAHRGLADDDEGYRKVQAGWAHYLQNLKRFVETGNSDPATRRTN